MTRFILCSFALVLLYPTAIDLYLVGLPQIAKDLGASESQLHIAFSVYLAGMATTMVFAGKLSDVIGRRPIAITGAIIFTLASFMGSTVENSQTFLIVRFIQGVGAGSCYVVAFAILRDKLDDKRRVKVLSMVNGITCIMPVIAPVIGHLIMLSFPWPSLFITMAGMGGVVSLLSVLVLKETNTTRQSSMDNLTLNVDTRSQSASQSAIVAESLYQRFFLSRLLISSIAVTAILTFVNVSPMLIMNTMGFSRGEYSIAMALTALVSMLTSFAMPLALSYIRQGTLMLVSQILFVAAAVILGLTQLSADSQIISLFGFSLICAGFSIGFGVVMSQALSPYRYRAGIASSILGVAQICSSALYIWLLGLFGVSALNMLLLILLIGGVISAVLILFIPSSLPSLSNEEIISTP
ncbi:MFS transporter [Shewanella ulleungensis]|uniref:Multidrug resistance protein MdtL n=1 Tax=Shewanella ulleungensis TaxID=2282699 RepID=A0ABQ2QIH7_9GAMM|nr:MFS transporter [Shewanella ulleungensis]MCL1152328.1 MFS transporter [Shewanella ulleungensis]GGP82159.1 multidrug resistance protein MdtL [Shewanella ulleungensis]